MSRTKTALQVTAAIAVLMAAVTLVWSAVSTSSARVQATTSAGTSFFTAGVVDLAQPDSAVDLLFDATGLYPGVVVSGCVEIEYRGSVPASVRLHASRLGGNGLEAFIDLQLRAVDAEACADAEEAEGTVAFNGRLAQLWTDHPSYHQALVLRPEMSAGDRVVIVATAVVVDDNRAQGLSADFAFTVEARP